MERLGQQYPCNPLWAQLNDLFGSLGTPVRVAQTVIAGGPDKAQLIEQVLNFLTYFLRSGIVERRPEIRCDTQADVCEAVAILERTLRRKPALQRPSCSPGKRSVRSASPCPSSSSSSRRPKPQPQLEPRSYEEPRKLEQPEVSRVYDNSEESAMKKLKRCGTLQKSLGEYEAGWSRVGPHTAKKLEKEDEEAKVGKEEVASKVEVVVRAEDKEGALLRELEKTCSVDEVDDVGLDDPKLEALRRQKLADLEGYDSSYKTL